MRTIQESRDKLQAPGKVWCKKAGGQQSQPYHAEAKTPPKPGGKPEPSHRRPPKAESSWPEPAIPRVQRSSGERTQTDRYTPINFKKKSSSINGTRGDSGSLYWSHM
jgi:hypothetical protein